MKNKNKKTIVSLIISVFFVVFFQTIGYSSFSSTINITGESVARVETDVRITDFSVYEVEGNVVSSYEKFSKDTLTSNVSFPADSSSIIYKIEITNYGSNSIGILDIKWLSSELEYELIDYNLTDKLCGDNGICSNYAVKTFYIKIYVPFLYELCVLNGNSAIFLYKLMGQRQFIFVHITIFVLLKIVQQP